MAKSLDASDLKKAIDHLQAALVTAEKRESRQAADLKKLRDMMVKVGLSPADAKKLMATPPKRKAHNKKTRENNKIGPRKGKKVAPEYQLRVGKETHK